MAALLANRGEMRNSSSTDSFFLSLSQRGNEKQQLDRFFFSVFVSGYFSFVVDDLQRLSSF